MHWAKTSIIIFLILLFFSLSFIVSNDFDQDLGRHIKIGEIIVNTHTIPDTNLFSYTNATFPFSNHHWLAEVIYFIVNLSFGSLGLQILKTLCFMLAFGIVIGYAIKKYHIIPASIVAVFISPLVLERSTIRPEMFGYLFFSITLVLLLIYPKTKKWLILLPFILCLWVNIHISFIFGVFLAGLIFLKEWHLYAHNQSSKKTFISTSIIIGVSFLCLFINPHGIYGALYPLFIFQNYGYMIVENQNILYLLEMIFDPLLKYFMWFSPCVIITILFLYKKKQWIELILLSTFFLLSMYQIRHIPFFVLTAFSIVPSVLFFFYEKLPTTKPVKIFSYILTILFVGGIMLFFLTNQFNTIYDRNQPIGSTLRESYKGATDFVLTHNLPSPIFNNFDIGGYLIYRLYPKYTMFVDNRPEAYPKEFFEKTYIPLELYPEILKPTFDKYNIQTVIVNHTDMTDWGKVFMSQMINNTSWNVVYFDTTSLILSKKSSLKDIRHDTNYIRSIIKNEIRSTSLIQFAMFLDTLNETQLSTEAFEKAQKLNPQSCSIKKSIYNQYINDGKTIDAGIIKIDSWYCF
ncbi:MAG: hypothetical protein WCO06_05720 [Candidatus Roizmanbacteria bacterium]